MIVFTKFPVVSFQSVGWASAHRFDSAREIVVG
jgi:hypothetical protein